jgi:DNA-directed RNA polymerase subunit RPC12/RpoP
MPILYQYACFSCRKVFKQSWSDQDGVNVCPECAKPMSYMGTAFRAPKQLNVDQWKKAELLIAAGFDFTKDGGPKPRTLKDLPAFLEAHRLARRSTGERLLDDLKARESGPETPVTRAKLQGRVKRLKLEGRPRFELLGRELTSWARVLINVNGQWREGTFRFMGDGMKIVEPHVEVKSPTGTSGRRIFVTKQTVLRWPD